MEEGTTYWKPRWPNTVFFGSHRELAYRIDIVGGASPRFSVTTRQGPDFSLELARAPGPDGFRVVRSEGLAASAWLDNQDARRAISEVLADCFSGLIAMPGAMKLICRPQADDILPEGPQLDWALKRVYALWSLLPPEQRRERTKSEFIG